MPSSKTIYSPFPQRSARRRLLAACWVVGAFLGGLVTGPFFEEIIAINGFTDRFETARQRAQAKSTIDQLKLQIAVYENASRVDQLAVENIEGDLQALQNKLVETGKELEFYRRIVSPKHRDDELRIQDLRLQGQQLALTLSQGIGRNTTIKANAGIQFSGRLHGNKKVLTLQDIDLEKRGKLEFSFRYFQTITADLRFPDGFKLVNVTVTAALDTKKAKKFSRTWSVEKLGTEVSASAIADFEKRK
ncbi:MAG: DUF6776 family protein [Methylococcales bacterium]